jgi:L-ascorbate metabolism protein UlaG (beta-lactamase superfamily)
MAFIPIGAYAPRWFMKVMHLDVPEAVQVRADLRAERAIGMHWGTFEGLTDEPLDEPPRLLTQQREALGLRPDQFDVLAIGETRRLERAAPRPAP